MGPYTSELKKPKFFWGHSYKTTEGFYNALSTYSKGMQAQKETKQKDFLALLQMEKAALPETCTVPARDI